jgi:acyl dehydratase
MPRTVSPEELRSLIGIPSEPSTWLRIDQERIDRFADATGDHQFIHVDAERAAQTPFGATIAHGFLTLSLIPCLLAEIAIVPEGTVMAVNYGLNRVRFLQPVVVGSEVRARATIREVEETRRGRILTTGEVTVEIRGQEKPALVAEALTLFVVP